jgi:murein DD-endopeptidase MepM/ murein hydrolase activator NlpD
MSAIINAPDKVDLLGSLGTDGIRRYKTRCKILLDSHLATETLVLIDDVLSVQTSKTIKGAGQATFILTPSENYLNLIFPNDYVNIYFDIGDGSGWTRTFFGLVDRVEEEYVVGKEGHPRTSYKVVCSDFHKVFERTNIYFNPHLANRKEFVNYDFAKANVAGLALMTKGILAGGTPPDIIQNVITQTMGFGSQFQLPPSYTPLDTQKRLRKRRTQEVAGRLPDAEAEKLAKAGYNYAVYKQQVQDQVNNAVPEELGKLSSIEEERKALADSLGIQLRLTKEQIADRNQIVKQATQEKLKEQLKSDKLERGATGTDFSDKTRNYNALESTISEQSYLIDILDMYTFVEKRAIDGYLFGQPVWQKQGSLLSILRSFSNEPINELFFDLRPLNSSPGDSNNDFRPVEGAYSTVADDKKGNTEGKDEKGITMIPAVVMREYPFATVSGVDLSDVELLVRSEDKPIKVGPVPFGAIFSDKPNTPGRHIVNIPNINVDDRAGVKAAEDDPKAEPTALGYKHLDVAVVSEGEIIKSTLGRSDADHFNLFEFYSDAVLGKDKRFYMKDVLPIITPVHILRNGLRPRTITTRAARFSLDAVTQLKGLKGPDPVKEEPENATTAETLQTFDPQLIQAPVTLQDPSICFFNNSGQGKWGYRRKPKALVPDEPGGEIGGWVFHQGIDIAKNKTLTESVAIPVYAIADGLITHCFPTGVKKGYGNHVVILHNFEGMKGYRYSLYAHLASIEKDIWLGSKARTQGTPKMAGQFASSDGSGVSKAVQKSKEVKKGQLIGYMGNTGTSNQGTDEGIHLHFEITRRYVSRDDTITKRIPFSDFPDSFVSNPAPPATFDVEGVNTNQMVAAGGVSGQRSCDPVAFYSRFGKDLVGLINGSSFNPAEEGASETDEQDNGDGTLEERVNDTIAETQAELEQQLLPDSRTAKIRNQVDGGSTRRQILRWALLQDHWYQHNLEYLSGRIDMRGAPEIRVGYRLDIQERNMSFYVEGVNHTWSYPNSMKTNLQVSRGQPNNPYPLYVYPYIENLGPTEAQRRNAGSRLATYFVTPDPIAIRRSLFLRGTETKEAGLFSHNGRLLSSPLGNNTDRTDSIEYDAEARISRVYDEMVVPAGSQTNLVDDGLQDNEDARDNAGTSSLSGTDAGAQPKGGS